jgi:hypothetical protein
MLHGQFDDRVVAIEHAAGSTAAQGLRRCAGGHGTQHGHPRVRRSGGGRSSAAGSTIHHVDARVGVDHPVGRSAQRARDPNPTG